MTVQVKKKKKKKNRDERRSFQRNYCVYIYIFVIDLSSREDDLD